MDAGQGFSKKFLNSWTFVRGMTYDFIEAVPPLQFFYTPNEFFGPFAKQVRHMVWVSGLYNDALLKKKIDLANKKKCYGGSLERRDLLDGLREQDEILARFVREMDSSIDTYRMDFFGATWTLEEFLFNMIQHESLHHGMWTSYAKLGGFATPEGWQKNWEL